MSNANKHIKVIISGGGTGGHVFPAIAIAHALKKADENIEILFVGAKGKLEMEKVPAAGFNIVGLNVAGFQRRLTFKNLIFPFKLMGSMMKARGVVKRFKPDVAVGVGGYASGPTLKAANWKGIPTVIQEQNSYAGLTNKLLSQKAAKICVAYEGTEKFFPADRIVMTGNPVRETIVKMDRDQDAGRQTFGLDNELKTILVIGGSLGARTLNESMKASLKKLNEANVQVLWQTGKYYHESCKKSAQGYSDIHVHQFITAMDKAYAAADVIISRAGALSISELCIVGKPCILVPSPNVSEDHQTHNAMALVNKNAALLVKDSEAEETLIDTALELLNNETKQTELSQNIQTLAIPDAADRIAKEVLSLVK